MLGSAVEGPGALAQDAGDKANTPQTLEQLGETPFPGEVIPPELNRRAVAHATAGGLPYESRGVFGMGPHATPEIVRAALKQAKLPDVAGPVEPTWASIAQHYELPDWIKDGKFGIFLHFGLYSVPAHQNEWYEKYLYMAGGNLQWHIQHFGPLDQFGYKDFIPMFTLPKFDPNEWAKLFKDSGAVWAMPTAEHHDGFSLWNSKVNKFNSVNMGPHRDIIGELATAVRAQGLKFGVTNHTIEHYDFIEPDKLPQGMATDLDAAGWEDFYWTHHSDAQLTRFLAEWIEKDAELIDQYHPDVLWFDNGINNRMYDPLKLRVAAYYYSRAREWGRDVTLTGKGTAWIAGGLQDFEGMDRAPKQITDYTWMTHDKINRRSWGWVEGDSAIPPAEVIGNLVTVVSRNGIFALNLSPRGDGSIPEDQQRCLREVGAWLKINGEAIHGSHPWTNDSEGNVTFTTRDGALYAIVRGWPGAELVIPALSTNRAPAGTIRRVGMLGIQSDLAFKQEGDGLHVTMPEEKPCDYFYTIKIEGFDLKAG